MSDRLIVFHHLPKSGGSYVITALANALKRGGETRDTQRVAFGQAALPLERVRECLCMVSSHWAYKPQDGKRATATGTLRPDDFYFTWERSPAEMLMSAFAYYRSPLAGLPWTQDPYLQRQIGQMFDAVNFPAYVAYLEAHNGMGPRGVPPYPVGHVLTKKQRRAFDFIGRCETMEADLKALGIRLGVPLQIPKASARNAGPGNIDRAAWRERVEAVLQKRLEANQPKGKHETNC